MGLTREEAQEIIQNIDARLEALYPDHPPVTFSSDPQTKRIQQVVMYRLMRKGGFALPPKKDPALDEKYNNIIRTVTDQSSLLMSTLLNHPEKTREEVLEGMIAQDRSSSPTAFEYTVQEATKRDGEQAEKRREKVLSGAFAPTPDIALLTDNRITEETRKAIAGVPLNIPMTRKGAKRFTDREAAIISLAELLSSDDLMDQFHVDSTGITESKEESAAKGRDLFFTNTLSGTESRIEGMTYAAYVADARKLANEHLQAYGEGDIQPLADVLKKFVLYGIQKCRIPKGPENFEYFNKAKITAEIADILDKHKALRDEVEFTPEEAEMLQSIRLQVRLRDVLLDQKAKVLKKFAENPSISPADFVKANMADIRRLAALEYHRKQHNQAEIEIDHAVDNLPSEEEQVYARTSLRLIDCDREMLRNPDQYVQTLESHPEVEAVIKKLTEQKTPDQFAQLLQKLSGAMTAREHTNVAELDHLKTQADIDFYTKNMTDPDNYPDLIEKLKNLSSYKEQMPENPSSQELDKRIAEYEETLRFIENEYPDEIPGTDPRMAVMADLDCKAMIVTSLTASLNRLKDAADPVKAWESLEFVQNLVEQQGCTSYNFADEKHHPISPEKAEQLRKTGGKVFINMFPEGSYLGKTMQLHTGKNSTVYNKADDAGKCTRAVDFREEVLNDPKKQLEKLKELQEILKASDPLYIKNSDNFNKVMKSLDTVIQAQEALPPTANIRQLANLREMYETLSKNLNNYTQMKEAELSRSGSERGQLRLNAAKSLAFLTDKKHVSAALAGEFFEQQKINEQSQLAKDTVRLMKNWKNVEKFDKENRIDFQIDFDTVSEFVQQVLTAEQRNMDTAYIRLAFAQHADEFIRTAEQSLEGVLPGEMHIDLDQLQALKNFTKDCEPFIAKFSELSDEIDLKPNKPEKVQQNKKGGFTIA